MISKMKKATGTIKKTTVKKPTIVRTVKRSEDDRLAREKFLADIAKKFTGFQVSTDTITKVLADLDIKSDKEMTDDDIILLYNLLTEPLLTKRVVEGSDSSIEYGVDRLTLEQYTSQLLKDASEFEGGFISQRVVDMYENLPSLEVNRMNFLIDKDIFRDKPLLGKGLYQCKRCGSDDTEDYQQQTRSADEPMTTFVRCKSCKAYYRYN